MKNLNKNILGGIVFMASFFLIFGNQITSAQVNKNLKVQQKVEEKIQLHKGTSSLPFYKDSTSTAVVMLRNQQAEKIREEIRLKIQQIKDTAKKRVAENLINQMKITNERLFNEHQRYLSKLEEFLLKQEALINQSPLASVFSSQISAFKTKISELKDKINLQSQKEYLVQFQNENELRLAYQNAKKELINNHQELRKELQTLKKEIIDLIVTFRKQVQVQSNPSTN